MFLMSVLGLVYDMNALQCAMFSGDDSVFIGWSNLEFDYSEVIANCFNLEAKFLRNFEEINFCSKFIVTVADTVCFVPDPVKLLIKLGRHDVVNFEHLEQYRVSLIDLTNDYGNMLVAKQLSRSVADRYKTRRDTTMLIEHLYLLIRTKRPFTKCFTRILGMSCVMMFPFRILID